MEKTFVMRFIGVSLLIIAFSVLLFLQFNTSKKVTSPLVFADSTMLNALWDSYKQEYWEEESGRTLDKQQNSITTSEGQSYTMLRAVWQSDKPTFDKTWEFTKQQMQHENDSLFSWRWGQKTNGSYGVLTEQGGQNAASDGEVDISMALLMAAGRWQQDEYLRDAKSIINDIWVKEVIEIDDKAYLTANDLEKFSSTKDAVINPSYFAPYAFKMFAKVDKQHDWNLLVDSSYELTNRAIDAKLDKATSSQIPPDWFLIDKFTGQISPASDNNLTTNYGFDAMRTPWRLALDWQWNKDSRSKNTLEKMKFLQDQWKSNNKLFSTYSHDGKTVKTDEVPAIYGGDIGYFKVVNPDLAKVIYEQKLKSLYDPTAEDWNQDLSYYSDNWAWFGIALYNESLDNPAEEI